MKGILELKIELKDEKISRAYSVGEVMAIIISGLEYDKAKIISYNLEPSINKIENKTLESSINKIENKILEKSHSPIRIAKFTGPIDQCHGCNRGILKHTVLGCVEPYISLCKDCIEDVLALFIHNDKKILRFQSRNQMAFVVHNQFCDNCDDEFKYGDDYIGPIKNKNLIAFKAPSRKDIYIMICKECLEESKRLLNK